MPATRDQDQPHFAVVDQAVNMMKQVENYINVGMETSVEVILDFVENDKDNNKDEESQLKKIMLRYVKMERDLQQFLQAVEQVKREASESQETELESLLDQKLAQIRQHNSDEQLQQHEKYLDLEQRIEDARNPESITGALLQTPQEAEGEDVDIMMTQQEVNTKCPFTRKDMKNPVRNKHCGHHYEEEGISQHIKARGKKARCPVGGCANKKPVELSDLEEDKQLKRYIERVTRHANRKAKRSSTEVL